jgi:type VI secretion system protein ImpH
VASQKRQSGTPLKERLLKEYYSFSFFEAVHLLESLFPEKKALGHTLVPGEEVVRFSVKPGLTFPPSDISKIEHVDEKRPVDMQVTFMGLIGPSGVLPYWYNELAINRVRHKDFSLTTFLDMFHHRLISLFYLAWKKHRFPASYKTGARDRLSGYLLSLTGLGTPGFVEMIGLPEESLVFCSGLLSRSVPSAAAIEATVAYLSATQVKVEQFIDRLLPLSLEDQTQLGLANAQLGADTVCGSYVWDCQATFRINLGPMSYGHFVRLLPSGDLLPPVFSLVKYMVGLEYEFEIRLFLKREEVPPCILGEETRTSARLGWSTWIKTPGTTHQDDPYITFKEPLSARKND